MYIKIERNFLPSSYQMLKITGQTSHTIKLTDRWDDQVSLFSYEKEMIGLFRLMMIADSVANSPKQLFIHSIRRGQIKIQLSKKIKRLRTYNICNIKYVLTLFKLDTF